MRKLLLNRSFVILSLLAFVLVNLLFLSVNQRLDLTSSSIYTMSNKNAQIIADNGNPILATLLLGDGIPSSFKKLKNETKFLLANLSAKNINIKYDVFDPNQGNINQINTLRKIFAEKNIFPTNLRVQGKSNLKEVLIYPFIHFQSGNKETFVNILESKNSNESEQEAIFRSITSLEFKITKAIHELSKDINRKVSLVAFNEYLDRASFDFISDLGRHFKTTIVSPEELYFQRDSIMVGIIPIDQKNNLTKSQLLMIDQFVMNGGNLIWLLEEYDLSVDSINKYVEYIPKKKELAISDYLFKIGIKLSGDWVGDLRASRIPQVIGERGGRAQTELFNYPYHPVLEGSADHVISSDLGEINMFFPTIIDTVQTSTPIKKTVLLKSSQYSKRIKYPFTFSFDFLRTTPNIEDFSNNDFIVGLLLEGRFGSYFSHRYSVADINEFKNKGIEFKEVSDIIAKQIIITDQNIVIPGVDNQSNTLPIGNNKWERSTFPDNKKFIINAIEYLINGDLFLLPDEKKELVFASLDKRKVAVDSQFWIIFNLITPLLILLFVYYGYGYYLKRQYA